MMNWLRRDPGRSDELGRDIMLGEALGSLDPSSQDPSFWLRFHDRVMADAGSELARRRMLADLTMSEVMASWSRALVPTAVLAATVAMLLLTRTGSGSLQQTVGVEEFLLTDIPAETVPAMLATDAQVSAAIFASEIF